MIFSLSGFYNESLPADAQLQDEERIIIEFMPEEDVQAADVRPWEHSTVTFSLIIETFIQPTDLMKAYNITLSASTNKEWAISINPPKIKVQPGESEPFAVTVSVPHGTSSTEEATLTVWGTALTDPGNEKYNIDAVTGEIVIEQFYYHNVSYLDTSETVDPGDIAIYEITVYNTGNCVDEIAFEIVNLKELKDEGFYIHFSPTKLSMPENSINKVQVIVESSESTSGGTYDIELQVYSPRAEREAGLSHVEFIDLELDVTEQSTLTRYSIPIIAIIIVIIIIVIAAIVRRRS
jgi:uncharacterized membrane protein